MTLTLGPDWERELLASPYRLRFELSQGGAFLTCFADSFDRARALARSALSEGDLVGIIAASPDPHAVPTAKRRGWTAGMPFKVLADMGVPTGETLASWSGYFWPHHEHDPEVEPWTHRAMALTWAQADILLWNQVAQDMGVTPRAPVVAKLVDVKRGLSVYAYDDRGMDITSIAKETTAELYERHDAWLLDYDRERMAAAFGS